MCVCCEVCELYFCDQVEEVVVKVVIKLVEDYFECFLVFVIIMNGGIVFVGQLFIWLDILLEVDYLYVSCYLGEISGGDVQWIVMLMVNMEGCDVVIFDDILDVGFMLLLIIDVCKVQGVVSVKICVLVDKVYDCKVVFGLKVDYIVLEVEDLYLFGMGMDYKGYWCNVLGIFVVEGVQGVCVYWWNWFDLYG